MATTILNQLSIWIIVIPFLVGVMNYRLLNKDSRWILVAVIAGLVPQVMAAFLKGENTALNAAYNIYIPVELVVFGFVFVSKFTNPVKRNFIRASIIICLLINFWFFISDGLNTFLHNLVCLNSIVYMLWILLLLRQEYNADDTIVEKSNPFTWYLIAIIIYTPCTVVHFSLYYYFRNSSDSAIQNLPVIHSVFNILMYLLFSVGLLIRKPQNDFVVS